MPRRWAKNALHWAKNALHYVLCRARLSGGVECLRGQGGNIAVVVEPPSPGEHDDRRDYSGPCDLGDVCRRRAVAVGDVEAEVQRDEGYERPTACAVTRARDAYIQSDADREHRDFDCHCSPDGVPQAEAVFRAARVERHVPAMGYPVENPMADYADPDGDSAGPVARHCVIDARKQSGPNTAHYQAVRPGEIIQVERTVLGFAWIDASVLPT